MLDAELLPCRAIIEQRVVVLAFCPKGRLEVLCERSVPFAARRDPSVTI
jgi:hypothetical protein